MLFSQRHGYRPVNKELQLEEIDVDLRNRLWNLTEAFYWKKYENYGANYGVSGSNFEMTMQKIWHDFFKWKINEMPGYFSDAVKIIEKQFFEFQWHRVYDFIEFMIINKPDRVRNLEKFPRVCNLILQEENSGYRIIDGKFTPITSKSEIQTIEELIQNSDSFHGVRTHIITALKFLSDRKSPDYRNSIKESISAVESICQVLTGDDKATLGDALNKLENHFSLHGALKNGFKSLYGYTSDQDGIRHAILKEQDISFSDAKYMLVSCSAFTNYLIEKVAELEIKIPDQNT